MRDPLLLVSSPLRYLDGEVNAVHKDFDKASLRVALAFPDLYELGMSHLGLKILYEIVNAREGYLAERVFAPWPDREAQLRQEAAPLTSLESGRPLLDFDMIGFTLPYEMTCTNMLNMLDLAGHSPSGLRSATGVIPSLEAEGRERTTRNRMADFFDFFLLGDGEEAIVEIAGSDREGPGAEDREETLLPSGGDRGSLCPPVLRPGRRCGRGPSFSGFETCCAGRSADATLRKRILLDLDSRTLPRAAGSAVPRNHPRPGQRGDCPRGCIQRCRFCQAGTTYRPYRERSHPEGVLDMAIERGLSATGYDEISLSALSCGDYRHLEVLLAQGAHESSTAVKRSPSPSPPFRPGHHHRRHSPRNQESEEDGLHHSARGREPAAARCHQQG